MPNDQADALAAIGTETPNQAATRVAREREIIREAEADIAAGNGIEWDAVEAWLNELDDGPHAPLPEPQSLPARRQSI